MKHFWLLLTVLSVGFLALSGAASSDELERARAAIAKGATLVDVRTSSEFAAEHLPNAVNLPVDQLEKDPAKVGAKDKPVVLYCASGRRSARAKRALLEAGFKEVHDLGAMANGKT